MFQNVRNLKNIKFPTRKHTFLQNRRSRAPSSRRTANHDHFNPKTFEKLRKIIEKTGLKTGCNSTLIFNDFCCHLASQVGLKFRFFFEFFSAFSQDRSNMAPGSPQERPKGVPRVTQRVQDRSKIAPRAPQEPSKNAQERPKSDQEHPKGTTTHKNAQNIHKHVKTHSNT